MAIKTIKFYCRDNSESGSLKVALRNKGFESETRLASHPDPRQVRITQTIEVEDDGMHPIDLARVINGMVLPYERYDIEESP